MSGNSDTAEAAMSSHVDQTCMICLDDLTEESKVLVHPCRHPFHLSCIRDWVEVKKVCPMCRQTVECIIKDGNKIRLLETPSQNIPSPGVNVLPWAPASLYDVNLLENPPEDVLPWPPDDFEAVFINLDGTDGSPEPSTASSSGDSNSENSEQQSENPDDLAEGMEIEQSRNEVRREARRPTVGSSILMLRPRSLPHSGYNADAGSFNNSEQNGTQCCSTQHDMMGPVAEMDEEMVDHDEYVEPQVDERYHVRVSIPLPLPGLDVESLRNQQRGAENTSMQHNVVEEVVDHNESQPQDHESSHVEVSISLPLSGSDAESSSDLQYGTENTPTQADMNLHVEIELFHRDEYQQQDHQRNYNGPFEQQGFHAEVSVSIPLSGSDVESSNNQQHGTEDTSMPINMDLDAEIELFHRDEYQQQDHEYNNDGPFEQQDFRAEVSVSLPLSGSNAELSSDENPDDAQA